MRKPIAVVAALLAISASACSRGDSPGGMPKGDTAGEGVTWDKIGSGKGGSGDVSQPRGDLSPVKPGAPPQIQSAGFQAGAGSGGDSIAATASAIDASGEPVTIEYAWTVNGQPAGSGNRLGSAVKRGDFVTVTIVPVNKNGRGRAVTLRTQVNNTPPSIAGIVEVRQEGDRYSARIQASDPDGDALRYGLVSGPAGMTVDAADGSIRWDIPKDFKGRETIMVFARDRGGAQATYAATIDVREIIE
jgi:hypothetical protein